jgi:hypothetical protein
MPVNIEKLIGLFNKPDFREWVKAQNPEQLVAVDDAVKTGNKLVVQAQVISWYNMKQAEGGIDNYLSDHFPDLLEQDMPLIAKVMKAAGVDPNNIFTNYHPNQLRFPMQMMFESNDPKQLKQAIAMFTSRHRGVPETLIYGNLAYIEYIPDALLAYSSKIPAENWEIRIWKARKK